MSEFELYCFAESGNSFKVAQYLELAGLDWRPINVKYFDGETHSKSFRQDLNVQGECPVLKHEGKLLTQSGVILTYLVDTVGQFGWDTEAQRYEILRWLLFDNHKLTSNLATYRYGYSIRRDAFSPDALEFVRSRLESSLTIVENVLSRQRFIAETRQPSIADLSISAYLLYPPEEHGLDLPNRYPSIARWIQELKSMEGWGSPYQLMPRGR